MKLAERNLTLGSLNPQDLRTVGEAFDEQGILANGGDMVS
jgi:hypothetical protein